MLALLIQLAIANPASVYCIEQGGKLEIVHTDEGDVGYCALPDGRRIEEWEFFRARANVEPRPRG